MNSYLLQLQKLGIDVWVTRQQAEELKESGSARALHERSYQPGRPNRRIAERRPQVIKRDPQRPPTQRISRPKTPEKKPQLIRPSSTQPSSTFSVGVWVYRRGDAVLILDYETQGKAGLVEDILTSLAPTERHTCNRFEFFFPFRPGEESRISRGATLEVAQATFNSFVGKFVSQTTILIVVGEKCQKVSETMTDTRHRIELDNLPESIEDKTQLWQKLLPLTV